MLIIVATCFGLSFSQSQGVHKFSTCATFTLDYDMDSRYIIKSLKFSFNIWILIIILIIFLEFLPRNLTHKLNTSKNWRVPLKMANSWARNMSEQFFLFWHLYRAILLHVAQPTNAQTNLLNKYLITQLYLRYAPTCFDVSASSSRSSFVFG